MNNNNQEELEIIRQEILDRYDIYDMITLTDVKLEDVYLLLEDIILDNLDAFQLENLLPAHDRDWETYHICRICQEFLDE